ncbi:hypothetical protein O3M35_006988 [Rhynocoris fuscipes]|uniref:Lipid storage droplet binding protein 3 n=1 Tax=Rhynocoris fuscipes TaxID=488301 RepID=A0AAW1DHQ0_9HEMI
MDTKTDSVPNNETANNTTKMESVNRVAQLPLVESTVNMCCNIYDKVKESNAIVNSVLTTAEEKVKQAGETAQPLTAKLEGPIKKVDSMLCTGLDFVEEKVPCIKLPPGELYENTKNAISSTVEPAINAAGALAHQGAQKVASFTAPYSNANNKSK